MDRYRDGCQEPLLPLSPCTPVPGPFLQEALSAWSGSMTCDMVPLRSPVETLSLGVRHTHSFCILFAENSHSPNGEINLKSQMEKLGDCFFRRYSNHNARTFYFKERLPSVSICCSSTHTPHPEPFLTILSSIKFPPAMHTDIALTRAINHAGDLRDCGGG